MPKDRDLSFDAFKGFAIIAVVAIHAINPNVSPHSLAYLLYRQSLNFAVPAFFFISGYWSSKRPIRSLGDYKAFLKRRLLRVLVPYLFWSSVLFVYSFITTRDINGLKIIYTLLTGGAFIGYYFIIALVQLYMITPVLQYINRKLNKYGFILILLFGTASLFALYLSRIFNVIGHLPASLPFYSWIIYYETGLFIGDRSIDALSTLKTRLYLLFPVLISWLISATEVAVILSQRGDPGLATYLGQYNYFLFSSCLFSLCVIFAFLSAKEYFGRLPRLISTLGCYSFGIYLIHTIILDQFVVGFQKLGVAGSTDAVYQLALVAGTLAICFILISVARKLLPEFIYGKILGF
jgi:surface polysaccharide O-acyltransferase-like enzyme